jgi:hypothetical protein
MATEGCHKLNRSNIPLAYNMKIHFRRSLSLLLASLPGVASDIQAQGTAFTYQGRLQSATNLANGSYDVEFSVWTASVGPSQVGGTSTNIAASVANGLFTATMDFGQGVFDGSPRWLEIGVRTNGNGAFTTLPRDNR